MQSVYNVSDRFGPFQIVFGSFRIIFRSFSLKKKSNFNWPGLAPARPSGASPGQVILEIKIQTNETETKTNEKNGKTKQKYEKFCQNHFLSKPLEPNVIDRSID